jgi:TolB-like protein/DNA-binding winged helix-turn-helix (wHTH) protein
MKRIEGEPMSTSAETVLAFAGYFLDARRRLLIGPDGAPVDISSRAFELLYYLASHPHELIEKQRLLKAVWHNAVVEENNLHQQISALRKVLGEAAGDHRFIVTVTGRGFRFVQNVERLDSLPSAAGTSSAEALNRRAAEEAPSSAVMEVATGNPAAPAATGETDSRPHLRRAGRYVVATAAASVVLIAGAAYAVWVGSEPPPAESSAMSMSAEARPRVAVASEVLSIAVLPFADLSTDHDQMYFAEGLSEELLTALGRIRGLRVIGRTSSFSFKGKNEDTRRLAAALGVRHLLEGSVRRDGERLRITARLVDGTNGSQVWSETYERKTGDVFTVQEQIADSVAATLRIALRPERVATAGRTRNVEAYDAYLAGRAVMNRFGSTHAREAIELLERAVRLDQDFALAWAALAEAYTFAMDFPSPSSSPLTAVEVQQRISSAALRAFELAPDAPETLRSAGMVSMQNRNWAEAERRLHRAAELAGPYNYDDNMLYATFLMNVGRANEAVPYIERAMHAEPLLLRPVVFRAALHEMRGELDAAELLLQSSSALEGHESMRKQGLIMIGLARRDRRGLRRLLTEDGSRCPLLDDPPQLALQNLRRNYEDARTRGSRTHLLPMADFALFLGDRQLSLEALRASASTQTLHGIWRPALSEVRRLPQFGDFVQKVGLVDYWRATGKWGDFCHDAGDGNVTCR